MNPRDPKEVEMMYHQCVTDVFEEKIPLTKSDAVSPETYFESLMLAFFSAMAVEHSQSERCQRNVRLTLILRVAKLAYMKKFVRQRDDNSFKIQNVSQLFFSFHIPVTVK